MIKPKRKMKPWFYLLMTFLILIIIGSILLRLPIVSHSNHLRLIDIIFTATSAVCVTGLTVVNTSRFNLPGQVILIVLMQLGGLGIMYLSSSLVLLIKGDLKMDQRQMLNKLNDTYSLYDMGKVLSIVVLYTFIVELAGFFLLFVGFSMEGLSASESAYISLFHAVSAFCNAGFSTFDTSIAGFNNLIKITVMLLIVLGGIGFYVVYDLMKIIEKGYHIRVHTKVVLAATSILIILGGIMIYFINFGHLSIIDAFFQSITARTAGFNTVDISSLHTVSILILIGLMIVGASPGSTGGGVKTTTSFVAFCSIFAILRGSKELILFKRKIPDISLIRAFSIILLYLFLIFIGTILILLVSDVNLISALFEITSALGTVGLSLGITNMLDDYGKIVIITYMFIGRVGPPALLLIMIGKEYVSGIKYPEEKVLLG